MEEDWEADMESQRSGMEQVMLAKATELFTLCDTEGKGFITKRDMQRLRDELPITPDQLEIVFDELDIDRNGYLTLAEFTEGFGSFLGLKPRPKGVEPVTDGEENGADVFEAQGGDKVDADKVFADMMMQIDARGVFQDEDVVKAMWLKLHHEEPELVSSFEDFLARMASDIKKSRGEFQTLESVLKSKTNEHEEEVKKLYEEMEFQMKLEQERILAEEKAKERQLREEMESKLREKERQLMEMQNRHLELEEKLAQLNALEASTKQENQRLLQEKETLEEILTESQESLEESRAYIAMLQAQQREEKKARARTDENSASGDFVKITEAVQPATERSSAKGKTRAALQLSEGIAMERESLVKQLDMLKDVNKKLLDDKDEAEAIEARRALAQPTEESPKQHRKLVKQGSLLSKYFPGGPTPPRKRSETLPEDLEGNLADLDDDGIEMDDMTDAQIYTFHDTDHTFSSATNSGVAMGTGIQNTSHLAMEDSHSTMNACEDVNTCSEHQQGRVGIKHSRSPDFGRLMHEDSYMSDAESEAVVKKTSQLGSQTESVGTSQDSDAVTEAAPAAKIQRIFKVVFVGDSGVGKSSFIHRFCNNTFRASFSATIGVDFQVKPLTVDDTIVVLQLWDTAGQERFRSVTKQYFRKADGVIVMYDVTAEQSYLNVRQWMDSVKEGVEEGTVISVIGNKTDLFDADPEHVTKVTDGSKMAVEYDALFYETSAKTGSYVAEAMVGMASLLKDKEDKAMEAALKLTDPPKKKGCCKN